MLAGFRPSTEAGRVGLAALLADPAQALIALDFDGTLAPIIDDPTQSRPLPQSTSALRALAPNVGTLAVITGRPATAAVEYGCLRPDPRPDRARPVRPSALAGRRADQPAPAARPGDRPRPAARRARRSAGPAGTWVEDKGDALAVHTRRTADPAGALEQLRAPLLRLAAQTGLQAEPGRLVIELRPEGTDKGQTLQGLAEESSRSAVLFGGDDLGDRPAFETIRALQSAGQPALAVCSRSAEVPELAAEADLVVDGPEGVAALLTALAGRHHYPPPHPPSSTPRPRPPCAGAARCRHGTVGHLTVAMAACR